jgi:uncharacterized membrane protein
MLSALSRYWRTSVMGSFLAGLLFLLPVMLTFFIVAWIIDFIRGGLGPHTFLGRLLQIGGGYIIGPEQNILSFWLGVGIALVGIWLLGVIVKTQAKSIIQAYVDRLFSRVPLIRSIYNPVSRVVRLVTDRGASGDFSGMSVVSCRFGGVDGVDVLALLASPEIFLIRGERRRLVYLPTSPLPMSGGLVLVAEDAVALIPEMKVDDLLKVFVSLGAMAPEVMEHVVAKPPAGAKNPPSPLARDAQARTSPPVPSSTA